MKAQNPEWIKFFREQYPIGSRIRLRELDDPYRNMAPGSEGTLYHIDDAGQFHIKWDDGSDLALLPGHDSFSVLPPRTQELKLYMPLTADFYGRDYWGDLENDPTELDGAELRKYEDQIIAALLRNQIPEEKERGIMQWYGKDDAVDQKVKSVVFAVENRNRQLWGVAQCQVAGELSPEELDTLKEYISGQASDGWGEGFEQREIDAGDGAELYVHLWNGDDSWSIQTELECFGPKFADGLPELCFSVLPNTGDLICIKRGETGYYPSGWNTADPEQNKELADYNNERLGVTPAQRRAMEIGSMCGWNVPGADPLHSLEQTQEMGGM